MTRWQRRRVEYYCALLASAALLPGAAALASSALYLDRDRLLVNGTGSRSLGSGIGLSLAVLAPPAAPGAKNGTAELRQVFDLANYPAGVVIAAVFGLTPTLLITRLQRQTEQYKADLRGSEAGEKGGGAAESSA